MFGHQQVVDNFQVWSFSSLLRCSTVKRIFDNCDTYLGFVDTGTFRNRHGIHLRTPKSEDLDYFEGLLAAKIEAYGSSKDYLEYASIRELAESIQNSKGKVFISPGKTLGRKVIVNPT